MASFVRPFEKKDRDALLQIGADTAFFGMPIERYMEDRRIFMDAFYAAYTDYESRYGWIAAEGDRVLGFLTGCIDTRAHDHLVVQKVIPQVAWRVLRRYYHMGPAAWR